ncbi:MAG: dephospho-CoA kinase [Bacteroides sp.]|nr:dephospho-CoA kinase [Barnesiella sp.]MBD5368249.1 dephospho-CoA kinase [Bacteroides sp.]
MTGENITIAISGGIGSGKSVVSRMLSVMGYDVYDCDVNARKLMDADSAIKAEIASDISPEVIIDGNIDRKRLAQIVFNDPLMLTRLNDIVHSAVRHHLTTYRTAHRGILFFESAILAESGFHTLADRVWEVIAPLDLRIERVMRRNNLSREEVEARIASQSADSISTLHPAVDTIVNDDVMPLLTQVSNLLSRLGE